jgi:hypothetical protein
LIHFLKRLKLKLNLKKNALKIVDPLKGQRVKIKPTPVKRDKAISTGNKPYHVASGTMIDKDLIKKVSTGVNTDLVKENVVNISKKKIMSDSIE